MDARDTLLLACGTPDSRKTLRSLFEDSFNLLEADNSQQARLFLEQNRSCIAAVLLNITVAGKIDPRVFKRMQENSLLDDIPVVIFTDERTPDHVITAFEQGATDVYPADCDPFILRSRIHNIVELYRHKWHLQELVEEQAAILRQSNDTMVDALSSIIEYRSVESGQHILRIRRFTQILLEEVSRTCPEYELTPATIRIISSAAALHDVGKISIPDSILNKPGPLTGEEWEVMRSHAVTGCRILESLGDLGNQDYLRYAHNIAHYHHERWDGSGYPDGLAGDAIPICAQVVGLADAYDALTTNRVYKGALPFEQSVNMILNGECGVFSPKLLECFKHVSGEFEKLARSYADGRSPKAENFDVTLPPPSRMEGRNSLHAMQTKFQSMLHYVDAAVIEVDLDQGVYHLVYNPDPNLVLLRPSTSFSEMQKMLAEQVVLPEDVGRFQSLLHTDIPRFFQDGLHRQNHRFRIRNRTTGEPELYEITLLRLDPSDMSARRMLIVWQKAEVRAARSAVSPLSGQDAGTPYGLLAEVCRCRNDAFFTLESGGARLASLVGYSTTEIGILFQNRLIDLVMPQDRPLLRQQIDEQLSVGRSVELTYRLLHKDGHTVWVLHKGQLVLQKDGREYLYNLLMDISLSKRSQESYDLSLAQYQDILTQTGNILFEWDILSDTMTFSDTWECIFGYTPLSRNFLANIYTHSHLHPDDIPRLFEWLHALQTGSVQPAELRIADAHGRYLWCRFRGAVTCNEQGTVTRIMGIIVNIDADVQAANALRQQADQDSLTKLLNKQAARRQAEDYLSAYPKGAQCALLIIDLDNFKQVNDLYGHLFGDAVLSQAAKALRQLFRAQDIVARIGGDEFLVLMRDTADPELVKNRCSRILAVFDETFRSQMNDCPLGCSIGVSLSPAHGTAYSTLFQYADQALYQAKSTGKNRCVFYDEKGSAYHALRPVATTRIDSEDQPGLADSSLVQYAFRRLYSSKNIEEAINNILSLVGQQMNVSRVYVFENSPDNRFCNNTYEWCNDGIAPEKDNLQNISYETDIPNYEANFDEHGIFYVPDVSELPQHLRDILEPQGIKSLLHCAIRDNGVFRGYIGFDECVTKRLWTKEQIQALTLFSDMLSVFLLKEQAQAALTSRVDELSSVLDNQKAWVYVIDPDTCQLRFLNARTREIAPDAREGMFCYKALMGLDERCPGCPAENIRQAKNHELTIVNKHLNLHVQSEATLIRWGGEEACLLSCREVQALPDSE